jgi:hypothetical protein
MVRVTDRAVSTLDCVDDFYDTLRVDIGRVLPHVVAGVERVTQVFASEPPASQL